MKTLNYTHLEEKGANTIVLSLQQLLADFQIHYANLRGFHWNIKGHGFFVLHSKFEDLYNGAAEKVDEIAERILMLGGTPANNYTQRRSNSGHDERLPERTGKDGLDADCIQRITAERV